MDVALIEHTQYDVDGDEGRQNQYGLIGQGGLESLRGALKRGLHAERHADIVFGLVDCPHRVPQRRVGGEIEGEGNHRKLALVVDGDGDGDVFGVAEGAERDLAGGREDPGGSDGSAAECGAGRSGRCGGRGGGGGALPGSGGGNGRRAAGNHTGRRARRPGAGGVVEFARFDRILLEGGFDFQHDVVLVEREATTSFQQNPIDLRNL